MSEYWKSIPKIYCKYCNVWYQDNKSSKDFHERSFKHKGNIKRHIYDIKKRGHEKQKEEDEFKIEMQKIERAALSAYEKDLVDNSSTSNSLVNKPSSSKFSDIQQQIKPIETNDHSRKEALETVANKLKKKHEWYECKTIEGKVYYYNKQTMETSWTIPKSGFISIKEQKELNVIGVPGDQSKTEEGKETFKHEQFNSGWNQIASEEKEIDLQLPKFKVKKKLESNLNLPDYDEIEFKEKNLNEKGLKFKKTKDESGFSFKKRKLNTENRRVKTDD